MRKLFHAGLPVCAVASGASLLRHVAIFICRQDQYADPDVSWWSCDNQGAFPIQSDCFYAALKGNGATVRFVLLPLEAHVYAGRESLETLMEETRGWLNTYVKAAGTASK